MDDDNDNFETSDSVNEAQNIKNLSIVFKDQFNVKEIREIYKKTENSSLPDKEIDNIIKNVLTSSKQVQLSAMDNQILINKLTKSMSTFDETGWDVEDILGEGTYGKVCSLTKGNETIAQKTFKMGLETDTVRELGCYALLTATNTKYSPKIFGMTFKPKITIAVELAEGTLSDFAKKMKQPQRIKIFPIVFDMAIKALEEFHSCGLIHGDIKPGNMLAWWNEDENSNFNLCRLCLNDFGISSSRPNQDNYIYTEPYRAPELREGNGIAANKETDVYAMGKTLQEFLVKNYSTPIEPASMKIISHTTREEQLLSMLEENPENRMRLGVEILTFPKRKWSMPPKGKMHDILAYMWEECQKNNYSKATFIQAVDILLRYETARRNSGSKATITPFAPIVIASYWGEQNSQEASKTQKKAVIEILQELNGLVYIPGLEYLEGISYDENDIINEFKRKIVE